MRAIEHLREQQEAIRREQLQVDREREQAREQIKALQRAFAEERRELCGQIQRLSVRNEHGDRGEVTLGNVGTAEITHNSRCW